jgi:hypothetical protein
MAQPTQPPARVWGSNCYCGHETHSGEKCPKCTCTDSRVRGWIATK